MQHPSSFVLCRKDLVMSHILKGNFQEQLTIQTLLHNALENDKSIYSHAFIWVHIIIIYLQNYGLRILLRCSAVSVSSFFLVSSPLALLKVAFVYSFNSVSLSCQKPLNTPACQPDRFQNNPV